MTPIRFSPLPSQSVAVSKIGVPKQHPSNSIFNFTSAARINQLDCQNKKLEIKSKLSETIQLHQSNYELRPKSTQKEIFNHFGILYQWLKESINYVEENRATNKNQMPNLSYLTVKIDYVLCRFGTNEGITMSSRIIERVKSSFNLFEGYVESETSSIGRDKLNRSVDPLIFVKLFVKIIDMLLIHEQTKNGSVFLSKLLRDQSFYSSAAVLTFQIHNFINERQSSLEEILEYFDCSPIELWKMIISYLYAGSENNKLPRSLRNHILDIEILVCFKLIWKSGSHIFEFLKQQRESLSNQDKIQESNIDHDGGESFEEYFENELEDESSNSNLSNSHKQVPSLLSKSQQQPYERLFSRLLEIMSEKVYYLCNTFKIDEESSEAIWSLLKQLITDQTEILTNMNIDLIIVCTIYAVSRMKDLGITLQVISDE